MPLHDTLGPYNSRDLVSPYDVANAFNQINSRIGNGVSGMTRLQAQATSFGVNAPSFILTTGYYAPGDMGGGLHVKVDSQPTYPGYITTADNLYYQYVPQDGNVWVTAFGARPLVNGNDTTPDSWQAFEDAKYFIINQKITNAVGSHTIRIPAGFFISARHTRWKVLNTTLRDLEVIPQFYAFLL